MNAARILSWCLDPSLILEDALGVRPDSWQLQFLHSQADTVLCNASRQVGKSACMACLAISTVLSGPNLCIVASPSGRQSGELNLKIRTMYESLGEPYEVVTDNASCLGLSNGARIVYLPDSPARIRGFSSPRLLLVDEASRVAETTIKGSIIPMRIESGARLVAASTPAGKLGWWAQVWHDNTLENCQRIKLTAYDCPRISREHLRRETKMMGELLARQEFGCEFIADSDSYFNPEIIENQFTCNYQEFIP